MRHSMYLLLACLCPLAIAASAPARAGSPAEPATVFSTDMDDVSGWKRIDGSGPKSGGVEGVVSSPVMVLNNGIAAAGLKRSIPEDTNWTIKAEVLFSTFKRGGWIGLFDGDRKQGYAVLLNSGIAKAHGGMGALSLYHCSREQPISNWKADRRPGDAALNRPASTGHAPDGSKEGVLTPPLIKLELRFEAGTKTLTLVSDGEVVATADAPDLADGTILTQVIMSGNTSFYIDNVEVTAAIPVMSSGEAIAPIMTLNVKDFGALGDGKQDDAPAFRAALEKLAPVMGPKELIVPKGTYRLVPLPDTRNVDGHVMLSRQQDLHVKGEPGAELIMTSAFHDGLRVNHSTNVTLENLTIDYDPLPHTQGTIIEADPESQSFVLETDEGFPLATDPHLMAPNTKNIAYLFYPDTTLKADEFFDQYIEKIEALEGRKIRLTSRNPVEPAFVGHKVAMVGRRKANAITFSGAVECTARKVTVYAAPALGFGLQGTDHVTIDGCTITQRPGSGRLMSTVADGIHVKWGQHGPTIENCWLQGMGDDSVNVGGTYQPIIAQLDDHTLIVENHGSLRSGDNIMLVNNATGMLTPLGKREKTDLMKWEGKPAMKLTFINALPTVEKTMESVDRFKADMVINYDQVAANPVIRNNFFGRHRVRGVLVRSPGALIEGNRFEDLLGPAIRIGHHYGGRLEGPNGAGAVIRNNTFINIRRSVIRLCDAGVSADADPAPQRSIENVVIADNRFTMFGLPAAYGSGLSGNALWIDTARNVLLKDNFIDYPHPNGEEAPLVVVNRASNVTIEGTIVQGLRRDPSEWLEITDKADADTIHVKP